LRILLLTPHLEPSDPAGKRWVQLSSSLRGQGLSLLTLGVQAGRALDPAALRQVQTLHAAQAFDLLISSGPPISAHVTAQAFSKMARISWVADWPEPFALESHGIRGWFDRRLEAKLVRAADRVLVSSEALARKYRALRAQGDASLLVVRNGFERSELRLGSNRAKRDRLRIVCSQPSDFDAAPFLETLNVRASLSESLEVVFASASLQLAGLVQEFELDSCVHCLDANGAEAAALEVSADVLLSFGLNSAYRSPMGLARMLARQRPILHVVGDMFDPSFEVFAGAPHLSSENNRFALTAALEAAVQGDWTVPNEVSSLLSPEQYCWDAIGHSLIGFVCVANSDRASSDRANSDRANSDRASSDRAESGLTGSNPAVRQTVSNVVAKT
jgi:hypothetical protein